MRSQSVHENRIYSLKMHCGDQYPDLPPVIQFINQVNIPCVDPRNGKVCIVNFLTIVLSDILRRSIHQSFPALHSGRGTTLWRLSSSSSEGEWQMLKEIYLYADSVWQIHGSSSAQEASSTSRGFHISPMIRTFSYVRGWIDHEDQPRRDLMINVMFDAPLEGCIRCLSSNEI